MTPARSLRLPTAACRSRPPAPRARVAATAALPAPFRTSSRPARKSAEQKSPVAVAATIAVAARARSHRGMARSAGTPRLGIVRVVLPAVVHEQDPGEVETADQEGKPFRDCSHGTPVVTLGGPPTTQRRPDGRAASTPVVGGRFPPRSVHSRALRGHRCDLRAENSPIPGSRRVAAEAAYEAGAPQRSRVVERAVPVGGSRTARSTQGQPQRTRTGGKGFVLSGGPKLSSWAWGGPRPRGEARLRGRRPARCDRSSQSHRER